MTDSQKLDHLIDLFGQQYAALQEVKADVRTLKTDVATLKSDGDGLKSDVAELQVVQTSHTVILDHQTGLLQRLTIEDTARRAAEQRRQAQLDDHERRLTALETSGSPS